MHAPPAPVPPQDGGGLAPLTPTLTLTRILTPTPNLTLTLTLQVAAFRLNVGRVPLAGGQRAELFCQFADARIRLVSDELDPLAAADLERAGVSFRAAGDVHSAARLFGCAGRGYTAHLGADSPEARRCLQALAALG